ncbi:protein DMR6-LIKE OXYGENASE 1-like [Magnolia sinica]|uniref:protein DMR6-LIKE OXYGENASE 1-like n=1 Tax=Magnolia sinica TaxID=86752 RepID=UPI00265A7F4E|nr:protein DMR6-LIKE OXYGENASE 1-like [Magnolia sinica]
MGQEVDLAFIQAPEHRPNLSINEAGGIPLVDLSPLNSQNSDDPQALVDLVAEIGAACRDYGFFQVINHSVPLEIREKMESTAKEFFALPLDEKKKVRRDEANPLGYYDTEHTKNVRDWKEVFDFYVLDSPLIPASDQTVDRRSKTARNQWPECPHKFRDICNEYAMNVEKLAFELLELISLSLNLPAKRLNGFFKDHTSRIRLNHYPPCPSPDLALGVGHHKDGGALTVLAQDDVGGLNVRRKADGQWVRVKPIPNSYIINVGDIIQVWSNDEYESVEHRAMVNSERERFSIPFFFNPANYTMVKPLEELTDEQNPPKYREYNWGEFRKARAHGNFKKMDVENLQIYHFKISK